MRRRRRKEDDDDDDKYGEERVGHMSMKRIAMEGKVE